MDVTAMTPTRFITLALVLLSSAGCATRVTESPSDVKSAEQTFGRYERVLLVKSTLDEPYAGQGANISAANRIDLVLAQQIGPILNDVEVYSSQEVDRMDLAGTSTLLIRPRIKQIKFLNVGTRLLAGPAGGSGIVVIDTAYVDGATDEVLANPGYLRKAGAWSSTFSSADNRMLTAVAKDVAEYTRRYRCSPGERWVDIEADVAADEQLAGASSDVAEDQAAAATGEGVGVWRPTARQCEARESTEPGKV